MARGRGVKRFRVLRVLPGERVAIVGYVEALDYGAARILARERYQGALRIELA